MKRCTKCGEEKVLEAFGPNTRASMGVNNWCRLCYNEYGKAYYRRTHEKRREGARILRAQSADKYNAKGRAWRDANPDYYKHRYQANKESIRRKGLERYWRNPKAEVAKAVAYAKANPHKVNAINARRNATKRAAPGRGISGAEWSEAIASTAGICTYCSRPARLTLDHIEPLSRGGAHDMDNVTPACKSCNCSKRQKPLLVWLAQRAA